MPRSDRAFCLRRVLKRSIVVRSFGDAVSRFFDWRESLVVLRPETLLLWHRPGQFFAHVCEPGGDITSLSLTLCAGLHLQGNWHQRVVLIQVYEIRSHNG